MTPAVMDFLRKAGPQGTVLEIGSYNVNGSARDAIPHDKWTGVDIRPGPGVDIVADATGDAMPVGMFDCVVISETLEHCPEWRTVLYAGWRRLKPGGKMVITTPAPGFPRHEYPDDCWRFTAADWFNLFRNQDIRHLEQWGAPHGPGSGVIVAKQSDLLPAYVEPVSAPKRGKIWFASALYESKVWSSFMHCVLRDMTMLRSIGVDCHLSTVEGDSYIGRAKNTLCARFLEDPDATVLMLIDWDHWWPEDAIIKLLTDADEQIVGADYPMKNNDPLRFSADLIQEDGHPKGRLRKDRAPLLEANWIPGGFLRIRRTALEKYRDAYPDLAYRDPSADWHHANKDRTYTAFFEQNLRTGGEDYNFCCNWKALGGSLWIEPDIAMGHWWPTLHMGHLDKHLRDTETLRAGGIDASGLTELAAQISTAAA